MGADDKYPTIEIDPPDPLGEAIDYWREHWLASIPPEGFSGCDPHERAILAAARNWHTLTNGINAVLVEHDDHGERIFNRLLVGERLIPGQPDPNGTVFHIPVDALTDTTDDE